MLGFLKYKFKEHIDSPERTIEHRRMIMSKPFLKNLYLEWYAFFLQDINKTQNPKVVEIGSGGGFLKELYPQVICSDIIPLPFNDMTFSALDMPFENESLSHLVLIDTFHHIPDSKLFLEEASRVLRTGGKLMMIEPYNSFWGRFIYKNFHHEPFRPEGDWTIPSSGPMSDANGALPYIVFERDEAMFYESFPLLRINRIEYHTPFRYLLSGGVSYKQLVPSWSFGIFSNIDKFFVSLSKQLSMFCKIEIEKIN